MKNPNVKILETKLLSDNWYKLYRVNFQLRLKSGSWVTGNREVYDRGNGATILLYNPGKKTVLLTRQFRMPTYLNQNPDGLLIETCAGILEEENPDECIVRETQEETGYAIRKATKLFEAYMSPGAVSEIIHFYVAEYDSSMKVSEGGGKDEEQEDIEVLEFDFEEALKMIETGEIRDGKTIILLQAAKLRGIF